MDHSIMYFYSIGIVLEDKKPGSNVVMVFPAEKLPYIEGEISNVPDTVEANGVNADGTKYAIRLDLGVGIPATWLKRDGHLISPSVVKGERVRIYTVGGTEKYYWESAGDDQHKRRSEVMMVGVMASSRDGSDDIERNMDHMYTATMDSENGFMEIRSTKDRGERSAWNAILDGKNGVAAIEDDSNNQIEIQSDGSVITVKNAEGTTVTVKGKTATVSAADYIHYKSRVHTFDGDAVFNGRVHAKEQISSDTDVVAVDVSLRMHPHTGNLGVLTTAPINNAAIDPHEDMATGG